ncbi:alpha/beta fold hydrolase [Goodfellowiella coeruleoviolacea]|uniref:Pimeloyl-ACP methyl ester carboxylesterase n=1 Tax=Goodfellowiella coeruleoviolacea TaxID=334858 RepID=A0AAE3KMW0_9PSEU|nr:alpha/beta hydrolase [Goodfellowiella coeruleoviolacea]MCP2168068.1 Pimeloyl-ACP methyl ester carboxylesterase [Goodfellowiella coeruleoviolacea]
MSTTTTTTTTTTRIARAVPVSGGTSDVAYDLTGSGPGLVLVHGTGATKEGWAGLTASASERYTVVAPNLSGSGATTDPGGPLRLPDLVAQVLGAAEHAGLDRFHLVGQSMGAVVAAAVAAAAPGRVTALGLVSGWVTTDARMAFQFDHWARLLAAGKHAWAGEVVLSGMSPAFVAGQRPAEVVALADGLAAMIPDGTARQCEFDRTVDIAALLPDITAPTLVVAAGQDQMVPPHHQRAMAEAISGARYVAVDAGHALPFERPELFAALVLDFLAEHPVG